MTEAAKALYICWCSNAGPTDSHVDKEATITWLLRSHSHLNGPVL